MAEYYNSNLSEIFDRHAPLKEKRVVVRPNTSWYNASIRHQKVLKRRLERKWKKSRLPEDYNNFRVQCEVVNKCICECKTEFLSNKIIETKGDTRRLFQATKLLLGDARKSTLPECDSDKLLADRFNHFFLDKIVKIRDEINNSPLLETANSIREKLFPFDEPNALSSFTPTTESEIKKIPSAIRIRIRISATCGLDPIPSCFVKQHIDSLVPFLTNLVNKSLETGVFPCVWKEANITPLLKKDGLDAEVLKNYRPVSNLAFISKLVEQVVASRIKGHLNRHNLWDRNQSAYRSFHSTETALLRVHNDLLHAIDKKKMAALMLLDLSAAFDTIDHKILLDRLSMKFGITGVAHKWISSYLHQRSQRTKIGDKLSDPLVLPFGVPQGSILGPLLFTLYVNPVGEITKNHDISSMFYADDSQLYISFDHRKDHGSQLYKLENCISEIRKWMQQNVLKLNDSKTEFIVFGSRFSHKNCPALHTTIGQCRIEPSASVKNLGVHLDRFLGMDIFMANKYRTINHQMRKISRIRKYLSMDACKTLVQALVISRLDYGSSLLYGSNKGHIRKLQHLQNSAARLICRTTVREDARPLLQSLHWLPVDYRIQFRIVTHVYRCLNDKSPVYLSELLHGTSSIRNLRSNSHHNLEVKRTNSKAGGNAFEICGPRLWNRLPDYIKTATNTDKFKKLLKTAYFKAAYNI